MIIKDYNLLLHGPLLPNLALQSTQNPPLRSIFSVVEEDDNFVFIRFEPVKSADAAEKKGVNISYFATKCDSEQSDLSLNAIRIAVLDYLDVHYLDFATIAFHDPKMCPKRFAEIVHGFTSTEGRLDYDPFLTLQWKPTAIEKGIRFTYKAR